MADPHACMMNTGIANSYDVWYMMAKYSMLPVEGSSESSCPYYS